MSIDVMYRAYLRVLRATRPSAPLRATSLTGSTAPNWIPSSATISRRQRRYASWRTTPPQHVNTAFWSVRCEPSGSGRPSSCRASWTIESASGRQAARTAVTATGSGGVDAKHSMTAGERSEIRSFCSFVAWIGSADGLSLCWDQLRDSHSGAYHFA